MQKSTTPLMQQYFSIKNQYSDGLLFFQVGDFYELFFDDAKKAAAFLGLTLTARGKNKGEPIPLCGVPVCALDHYLAKLVRGGFRVVICEQLEPPTPGTVVKRGVTQVLTPGTLVDTKLLDDKRASYLLSFFPTNDSFGLLFGELLSAQLFATKLSCDAFRLLESELMRFFPDEILLPGGKEGKKFAKLFSQLGYCTSVHEFDQSDTEPETEWLNSTLHPASLQSIYQNSALKCAFYNFYWYLKKNQHVSCAQFKRVNFYDPEDFLLLDAATQKNLELVKNREGTASNTLFALLDDAATVMGSRCIKKWIVRPLLKKDLIVERHDVVEWFFKHPVLLHRLQVLLRQIGDLERITGRIGLQRANIHDYVLLYRALTVVPDIVPVLKNASALPACTELLAHCTSFSNLQVLLQASLNNDLSKNEIIKTGFDQQLDELRTLVHASGHEILKLEKQERERTSINSLKIRHNNVHGYYIEITKTNLHLVPKDYIRSQTLVGKERFTTVELKMLEHKIADAASQTDQVEQTVFERIKREVVQHITPLRKCAQLLAHIDALGSFAAVAHTNNYSRPIFNETAKITICEGKHPVVAAKIQDAFIPNDLELNDKQCLLIITGPNMGGKSTYLRQTALISIMAQCGAFVSAQHASLPLIDRIFTRIGAGDDVVGGKSTFLVEMEETAFICSQATSKSLILLDEIGRGTSTFDGLAIAQAVVEFIYSKLKAYCLFATHYHELTNLAHEHSGITNYHAASKRVEHGIVLLYKILSGPADGSFGLEVAKMAQLPPSVVTRAHEILASLTMQKGNVRTTNVQGTIEDALEHQKLRETINDLLAKLKLNGDIASRLQAINLDELSPKQAFDILWELKGG